MAENKAPAPPTAVAGMSPERIIQLMAELDTLRREHSQNLQEVGYLRETLASRERELKSVKERNGQLLKEIGEMHAHAAISKAAAPQPLPPTLQPPMMAQVPQSQAAHITQDPHMPHHHIMHAVPASLTTPSLEPFPVQPLGMPTGMPPKMPVYVPTSTANGRDTNARLQRLAELEMLLEEEARASGNGQVPAMLLPKNQSLYESQHAQPSNPAQRMTQRGLEGEYVTYY